MAQIMEPVKYAKAEDRVEPSEVTQNGHALRLDRLPGVWLNTNGVTQGIVKVVITANGSRLVVHVFGAGNSGPSDWGEVEAEYVYANSVSSRLAAGFTAFYDFDFSEVRLQANWNQGLLVLAGFTTFKDGSPRSNYFSREFFHRSEALAERVKGAGMESLKCMRLDERVETHASVAPELLFGTWLNTNSATQGIAKVILGAKDGQVALQVFATSDPAACDWGQISATVFAADASSTEAMAFSASYDFGFMETQLQGHVRQGVLIIAKFDRFKDNSGRSNYFSKEFFYRSEN